MTGVSRVPVLMYHRVGEAANAQGKRFAITGDLFAAHMQALYTSGYRAISIDVFVDWLEGVAQLPSGSFLLTFDDGYRGVYEYALPVLQDLGWPFAVFLVSDFVGRQDQWTKMGDSNADAYPLLNPEEIHDMQARGCDFHSHTCSHSRLPSLGDEQLLDELTRSRASLDALLGREARYLAYPYGQVDERVMRAAQDAGYRAAFSTRSGFNSPEVNRFLIRRIDVSGTDKPSMLMRKINLGSNDGSLAYAARYYWKQIKRRVSGVEA